MYKTQWDKVRPANLDHRAAMQAQQGVANSAKDIIGLGQKHKAQQLMNERAASEANTQAIIANMNKAPTLEDAQTAMVDPQGFYDKGALNKALGAREQILHGLDRETLEDGRYDDNLTLQAKNREEDNIHRDNREKNEDGHWDKNYKLDKISTLSRIKLNNAQAFKANKDGIVSVIDKQGNIIQIPKYMKEAYDEQNQINSNLDDTLDKLKAERQILLASEDTPANKALLKGIESKIEFQEDFNQNSNWHKKQTAVKERLTREADVKAKEKASVKLKISQGEQATALAIEGTNSREKIMALMNNAGISPLKIKALNKKYSTGTLGFGDKTDEFKAAALKIVNKQQVKLRGY